jgi:hypothetical protein
LALRSDGSIAYWGYDGYDNIGSTPIGTNYIAIAGGDGYSLAITPVPSAVFLGGLGLTISGWLLKRKRKEKELYKIAHSRPCSFHAFFLSKPQGLFVCQLASPWLNVL